MQHEITERGPLLKNDGTLAQKGWARKLLLEYDRNMIKAGAWRIKEWDYYCILGKDYGISLTIADLSYMGLYAITFYDLIKNKETSGIIIEPFTMGKLKMPSHSATGNVLLHHKKTDMSFTHADGKRHIQFRFPGFDHNKGISGNITLEECNKDTMVIATPFTENKKAFYYNQKINCLEATGEFTFGTQKYIFHPGEAFAVLDWGRGVWSYSNHWYWGSASGLVNDESFGFNIGYGFGDTSAATENMIFYKGIAHKLNQVQFHINTKDYMHPWKFTSNDGRFEMDFQPAIDRYSNTNLLFLKSIQHQVFGYFTGKVILDDGTILKITNLLGFAEDVTNLW